MKLPRRTPKVGLLVALPLLAACTAATAEHARSASACSESLPLEYDIAVETPAPSGANMTSHATAKSSSVPTAIVIGDATGKPRFSVRLKTSACGDHADVAYAMARIDKDADILSTFDLESLPPLEDGAAPVLPPKPRDYVEGTGSAVRNKETVLARGRWSTGEAYAIRVTVH